MVKNILITKILGIFICLLFVVITFISGAGSTINLTNFYSDPDLSQQLILRINSTQNLNNLPSEFEIVGEKPGEWIDIIVSDDRLGELSDFNYEVIIQDLEEYDNKVRGEYHTLAEIESILHTIADDYPDITSLYSIGTTYENRSIWSLEITDNPGVDEGEPGIVFTGLHHAREWPSVEICLYIADQLTSQYGSNQTVTDIVNNRRLWLISCVNPDGYYFSHDDPNGNEKWRKNRRYFPEFGSYGVDPNRNYEGSCDGNMLGAWGSIGNAVVSHDPFNEVYCGPGPFSENESKAVAEVFLDNDICASLNWHTYGEFVLWPWGYSTNLPPDNFNLEFVGKQIAYRITGQDGPPGTYTPQQSCNFYKNTGGLNDWSYGYGHYVQGRPTFSYTIEACLFYHPDESYLDQVCAENFDGALYLLQEAENIRNVTSRVLPPVIDDLAYDDDGNYIVSWEEQNLEDGSNCFQLDELMNFSYTLDNAEDGKRGLIWSHQTDSYIYSSPALSNGRVYVGLLNNKIYCLDSVTGEYYWSYSTGGAVYSSPAVNNGRVYVGSDDGNIYCLNADNGDPIWIYPTYSYIKSSPAVNDDRIYIGSDNNNIYCLNADNGDLIWDYSTGHSVRSSPAVADGRIYIGSNDNKIYCLDAVNGSFYWSYSTGGAVYSSPAVNNGRVYVGSDDGKVYCLDALTGGFYWSYTTSGAVYSSPAIYNSKIYFGSNDKNIYCLNANSGDLIWIYETDGDIYSSPAATDGKIYVGSNDKKIYYINAYNGSYIWSYETEGDIYSSPVVTNGRVYIGSYDWKVYCFFASRLWAFNGFDISNLKSHSGDYCFHSNLDFSGVSSMRSIKPIPVTKGMYLSFWCYYDINTYDRAFVEVSRDGRCYDIFDSFSGSSNDWIYKRYSLDSYEGESIFIRFRYTTDILLFGTGFYVDDIMPIADFDKVTTLSDSITSDQFSINGRPAGVYFYRVRGFNNERRWGDFSTIEGIYVKTTPPNKPTIDGPSSGKPRRKYEYTFSAEDPENHMVSYFINWGDGTCEDWTDYVESGTEIKLKHSWTFDITEDYILTYTICAKVKDIYGVESIWGSLEVTIPRTKPFSFNFYLMSWFLDRFPLLEKLLNLIR